MTISFLDPAFLRELGPWGFTRQLERLALHLGFTDIANIDGPHDQGGDLIGRRADAAGSSRPSGSRAAQSRRRL